MIERKLRPNQPDRNSKLPITSTGYNTTTSNPNYQLSGIQPNYTNGGGMNLPFDSSVVPQSGFATKGELEGGVAAQQQFINNYNQFQPNSSFNRPETVGGRMENLRDFNQFNFKENFTDNKPLLYMLDTKNKHNTIYDNLNENLMKETIQEVRLNIDSYDRDITIYPNPFDYVVQLGPIVNSGNNPTVASRPNMKQEMKDNEKLNKKKFSRHFNPGNPSNPLNNRTNNSNTNSNDIQITADAFLFTSPELIVDYTNNLKKSFNPYLNRNFDNVKFLRLDAGVLPKYNSVKINYEWQLCRKNNHQKKFIKDDYERIKDYTLLNSRYIPDDTSDYNLQSDRFVQIYIKEIRNNYNLGTNPVTDKSFVLVFDKNLGILYWRGVPYSAVQTYKDSLLGEINKLSIQFYDSWGEPLTLNTSAITYEQTQILDTEIINPNLLVIENFVENEKAVLWLIERMTSYIKCFVTINFDIECIIPFYSALNQDSTVTISSESTITITNNSSNTNTSTGSSSQELYNEECFLKSCKVTNSKIVLNENIFEIKNIYEELDEFVTTDGFVPVKKKTKNGKVVNITIDQYIANVIWFDSNPKHKDYIKFNLESLSKNYIAYGFSTLDTLKNELINLPANKFFQNYLTFVMGIYTNELSTKVDFTQS